MMRSEEDNVAVCSTAGELAYIVMVLNRDVNPEVGTFRVEECFRRRERVLEFIMTLLFYISRLWIFDFKIGLQFEKCFVLLILIRLLKTNYLSFNVRRCCKYNYGLHYCYVK